MKLKKIYIIFLLFLIFFIKSNNSSSNEENKILIKVNDQIITSIDILMEIKYLKSLNVQFSKLTKFETYEISKKSLIREKIKEIELKKILKEIKIDKDLEENLVKTYFSKLGINSEENFNKYFISKGINPNFVKNKIALEVLWNQLIYNKYIKNVKIDKKKIKQSLLKDNIQKEYLLHEILFVLEDGEKLENKFFKIKKDIENKNFSEAVLIHSISESSKNSGKLGWIKESSLNNKIKNKIKDIKIGEFSEPIIIPGGFLILKIEDLRESNKDINLEKELNLIVRKKTNEQLNQFSNIYFNKIRKNIEIYEL